MHMDWTGAPVQPALGVVPRVLGVVPRVLGVSGMRAHQLLLWPFLGAVSEVPHRSLHFVHHLPWAWPSGHREPARDRGCGCAFTCYSRTLRPHRSAQSRGAPNSKKKTLQHA